MTQSAPVCPNLKPGDVIGDFTLVSREPVSEIDGEALVFSHSPSGAGLLWLANSDNNRAFSIAFKTPPTNDTGVFHILEHSVLDGSDKYPVKEPFVNLLKSSMQTFLNAMTFPDKTMYPVASTNVADLENLMDVYLDAVFHPALYRKPHIFEQEGWHYELESPDAPLTYNGVVFNEMKGALSDPDDVLFMHLKRQLFPDTCYAFESGGNPVAIPELTYEEFCDTHARHYQLANSHTVLYGDLDIERELAFLGERFSAVSHESVGAPNALEFQEAVSPDPVEVPLSTSAENRCVGVGYVLGTSKDRERVLAADVLIDALMGSNEAPLKRAILDAGLGDDVFAYLIDGVAQPMVIFELKGAKPKVAGQFKELLESTCKGIAEAGVPADRLEASLAQAEFNLREADFGYPDGVGLAICSMNSWLYDEGDPLSFVRYEAACEDLKNSLGLGVFDKLLRELVVDNPHQALVTVEPQEETAAAQEAQRLAQLKETLSHEELEKISCDMAELKAEQARPDNPEDVARLPHLSIADIAAAPALPLAEKVEAPYPCYSYDLETHHIDYSYLYFDLERVGWGELPYVTVLCSLLGKLDTRQHTAAELDTLLESQLGSFSTFVEVYGDARTPLKVAKPKLVVGAASLSEKVSYLATLPCEVCCETIFGDTEKIRAILVQQRIAMEQSYVNAGHAAALARCGSYFSCASKATEALRGIDYYKFLVSLLDNFDRRASSLCEILRNLQGRIFKGDGLECSFAGAPGDLERYWEAAGDLGLANDGHPTAPQLQVPEPTVAREGFTVPANVCFVAQMAAGSLMPNNQHTSYNGAWIVASKALNYGYLWNEVRVLGGAYGSGFNCAPSSLLGFYSYRDPAVDPTLAAYAKAGQWLASWDPTQEDLEDFIVSSVAGLDAPQKPRTAMRQCDSLRFSHRPANWRHQVRDEVLAASIDTVRSLASSLSGIPECGGVCVIGGRDQLDASQAGIEVQPLV